jgi:prolyl oligopeptidase
MNSYLLILLSALSILSCSTEQKEKVNYNYPETRKDTSVIDDYFGTKITDSYRWLEDDNSPETEAWVKTQNTFTNSYLEKIPFREKLKQQLTNLWDYESIGTPSKHGNYYIYSKNDGKQNQSVYYIK